MHDQVVPNGYRVPAEFRIMVVSATDEPELVRYLARQGHDVLAVAEDGRPERLLDVFRPDVVLVVTRVVTPSCLKLRHESSSVALVVIVPGGETEERIAALKAGADDCLTTPLHHAELQARIRAARRRTVGCRVDWRVPDRSSHR